MIYGKSSKIGQGFQSYSRNKQDDISPIKHKSRRRKESTSNQKAQYVGLFSGGRDSLAACHYLGVKEVIYLHTGVGVNESYVEKICKKLGWKLNILRPKNGDKEYELFIKKYKFPKPTNHSWIMHNLKQKPLDKWHRKEIKLRNLILISDIKRKESSKRTKLFKK